MFFSASSLVKKSAMALCYLRRTKDKKDKNLPAQIKGNKIADKKITGLKEMRGIYSFDSHVIFYCFDEIRLKNPIELREYKSTQFPIIPDYYRDNSIVQTALYHALAIVNSNKNYQTASFAKGDDKIKLDKPFISVLMFGDKKYIVKPVHIEKIVNFYMDKAVASLNYDTARAWDDKWKHLEAKYLLKYIKTNE